LDRGDADLCQTDKRLQPIDHLDADSLTCEDRRGSGELQFDGGKRLAELVVELAGERAALVLPRRLDSRGKLPERLIGRRQSRTGVVRNRRRSVPTRVS